MAIRTKTFAVSNNKAKFNRTFTISMNGITFNLFYEKWYYLENKYTWSLDANPDFTIEVDGEVKVIMDAKNYMVGSVDEAEYKMLGYLNNLDGKIGILYFPQERNRIPDGIRIMRPDLKLKNHIDQCLVDCVLQGKKSLWRKIGHYCIICDIYYNLKSQVTGNGIKNERISNKSGFIDKD